VDKFSTKVNLQSDLMLWGGLNSDQVTEALKDDSLLNGIGNVCQNDPSKIEYTLPHKHIDFVDDNSEGNVEVGDDEGMNLQIYT
jgi:hypothetical protein